MCNGRPAPFVVAKSDDVERLHHEIDSLRLMVRDAAVVMQRFVEKVDFGRARSVRTYAECRDFIDREDVQFILHSGSVRDAQR